MGTKAYFFFLERGGGGVFNVYPNPSRRAKIFTKFLIFWKHLSDKSRRLNLPKFVSSYFTTVSRVPEKQFQEVTHPCAWLVRQSFPRRWVELVKLHPCVAHLSLSLVSR